MLKKNYFESGAFSHKTFTAWYLFVLEPAELYELAGHACLEYNVFDLFSCSMQLQVFQFSYI